ncbi:TVP38/TMEM64 family protein [Candidatus Dependentiae bacterium]|nr:TVP38/TMEM64 family protein [Candidatus Dependentiae bacterium]
MEKYIKYFLALLISISILIMIYCMGFGDCFSIGAISRYTRALDVLIRTNYLMAIFLFCVIFAALITASFPIVVPLTLLGGYSFGVLPGTLYSCLAATVGSLISFALFRYVFAKTVQQHYKDRLVIFNQKIKEEGHSYLLTMHFMLVPFSIINVLAAVTPISWFTFIWTTTVGSFPVLLIYAFVGRQLRTLKSTHGIISWPVMIFLLLLAALAFSPIVIKRLYRK